MARLLHIGFEGDDVSVAGINSWKAGNWIRTGDRITVAHPAYPAQRPRCTYTSLTQNTPSPRSPLESSQTTCGAIYIPGTQTTSTRATHQSHPLTRLPRRMPYLHRHGARTTDPAVRQRRLIHDQSLDRHRILGQPDHLDMKAPAADEAKAGTNE